jgi:hypothetical protein
MPPLDFPNSPTGGQTYTGPGGIVWQFDGAKWANGVSAASAVTPSDASPAMDGTAAPGASALYSRGDHVHPTDTSRYAASNPSGYQTAAQVTAAVPGTNFADNAGFAVNQRAYVSGAALGAGVFGHDRWKGGAGGGTYTFTASPPSTAITITAGTLQQVIEGAGIVGGSYVLSWTGTAQGRVGGGAYAASPVTAGGITAGANTTIEFSTGTLSRVKFESGSVATPWQAFPPQQDIAKCQRFFYAGAFWFVGYGAAGSTIGGSLPYPVPMRAAPGTVAITSPVYTNASGGTVTTIGHQLAAFQYAVTAAGTAYFSGGFNASADI